MKQKLLLSLLIVIAILVGVDGVAKGMTINLQSNPLFYCLLLTLPAMLFFLHAIWTLSFRRGVAFFTLAFIIGLAAEIYGLKYGTVFGGYYTYRQTTLMLLNVPLVVPVYWAVFIYGGYALTNSLLVWISKDKPSFKNNLWYVVPLLVWLDGLVVVAIDLFMDPIKVHAGSWIWKGGGPYFGVPIGNFIGWFMVATTTSALFRIYEYTKPLKVKASGVTYFIPTVTYGMLCLSFFFEALSINLPALAMIGISVMLPIVLVSTLLFLYRKH